MQLWVAGTSEVPLVPVWFMDTALVGALGDEVSISFLGHLGHAAFMQAAWHKWPNGEYASVPLAIRL